jgi:hypothetical protein
MSRVTRTIGLASATLVAAPMLLLVSASSASAGSIDFGGGAGDHGSSAFSPTAQNCQGIFDYLRSHGGNISAFNNTFQNEWRQCAAGPIAGSFGKG